MHAASHGPRCATCQQDVIPATFDESSRLHAKLLAHLSRAPWAASLIRNAPRSAAAAAAPVGSSGSMATPPVTHVAKSSSSALMSPLGGGVTSRKVATASSSAMLNVSASDGEEDKYRRRADGFQRLVASSSGGVAGSSNGGDNGADITGVHSLSSSGDRKSRTRLSASRAIFLCLLLFSGAFLVYIALTLNKDEALH